MLAAAIVVLILAADRVTKLLVEQFIPLGDRMPLIPKVISLTHVENTGAAFGVFSDRQWIFMVVSVIAMAAVIWVLIRYYRRHTLLTVALSSILAGGLGNMFDRVFNNNAAGKGYVVDFLDFDFVNFAVFNVADIFITVGAVLLAVYVIFFEGRVEKRLAAQAALEEMPAGEDTAPQDDAPRRADRLENVPQVREEETRGSGDHPDGGGNGGA